MSDPVGHQQRVEFGRVAVIKGEHKLGPIGLEALQGMGQARGEVPQTAFPHIGDLWTSILVQNCHAAVPVSHHRPFRLLVPMKLTNTARIKTHVDA